MPRFSDPQEKHDFMLNTPIPSLVTRMALPCIAGMMVSSAYNLADTYFVSHLGTYATGAVGVNGAIDNVILMAASLVAVGSASVTARLLGAKEDEHASNVLSTSYFIAFLLGTIVLVLGSLFQVPLLRLLGANDAIMPYSQAYCRYILLAAPFWSTNFVLNQSLRSEGSAIFSMVGMVSGAVLNIGLDPLFIFVFDWGVAGASAATAISKLVTWLVLMTPYWRGKTLLKIRLRLFRPNRHDAWAVCSMGSASFFRNGLAALSAILLNRIAVGFSESALAAVSVANRVTMFMTSACLGFGQGFQPVAGYSWGTKRFDRVKEALRFSTIACVLGISVFAALVAVFAKPLLLCFTEEDADLVRIGVFSLRVQCLAMPFHGYGIIINMLSAGIGDALPATLMGLSRQGIFFYPVLPVLTRLFDVYGIASVQGVADMLTMLIAVPIAIRTTKRINKILRSECPQPSA